MKNITKILYTSIFILSISARLVAADEKAIVKEWNRLYKKQASAYYEGRYKDGAELAEKAYEYAKCNLGPKHPETLTSLNSLGLFFYTQGRYSEAMAVYKNALQLRQDVLGASHPDTLTNLNNLGRMYCAQGRYSEAEPLYKKALRVSQEILGVKYPLTLASLNNLGLLYLSQGIYSEAEPLLKEALRLNQEVSGAKHPSTLTCMSNLGGLFYSQGRYSEAEPLFKESLRLRKDVLGAKHPETLISLNKLGLLYKSQGRHSKAEPLLREALQLHKDVLGAKHPETLISLNNLGLLYYAQGRYSEAEPLYKKALRVSQEVLGVKYPLTLASLNNLGLLYSSQGNYSEAELLLKEALRLHKEALGAKHPSTLTCMYNLGGLFHSQGRYSEAEPLLKEALRLNQEVLGAKHPETIGSLNNLGGLYYVHGRYSKAEPLLKEALRMREEVLGAKHPDTLGSLNDLGFLYESQGRYIEATTLLKEAQRLGEEMLGPSHPYTINVMLNYAVCLINQKKNHESLQLLQKMETRLLARSDYQLYTIQKERVKRSFFYSKRNFQDVVFTFAGLYKSKDSSRFAANVALRWKQVQGEEQAFIARLSQTSNDPQIKELITKISSLRAILPRSFQNKKIEGIRSSEKIMEDLELTELELAGLSREYKKNLEVYGADVHRVRAALSTSAALIEFKLYKEADFKKGELGGLHVAASLILADNDELYFENLEPMDQLLKSFASENRFNDIYKFLLGRFDDKIKNVKTLYIAPDGVLNLIPFDKLTTPDGRYLVERQEIRLVQTGRDLLRSSQKSGSNKLIAMGGVEYNKFNGQVGAESQKANKEVAANNMRLREEIDDFNYLPASREEVNKIALYYKRSRNAPAEALDGVDASEEALKGLKTGPKILHLSTHGYYIKSKEMEKERPMLLAGLALAGANQGRKGFVGPDGEDGILYAIEALGLNLEGTQLVSLSACATGRGVLDYSEGVYGLVRAFRIAGAQSVLMTLTPVGDKDARDFMVAFYKNLMQQKADEHPATALRKTKLDFINHKEARYKNPAFWSPFVLVGK